MQLIVSGRFIENPWQERDELRDYTVLTPQRAQQLLAVGAHHPQHLGLHLHAATDLEIPAIVLESVCLVVIEFDASGDGRSFSVAAKLRSAGFNGELRARGPLLADQYPQLRASGFDSVEIPDELAARHTEPDWYKAYHHFPLRYQAGLPGLTSILHRRHDTVIDAGSLTSPQR